MAYNRVDYGGNTLIDLTGDTVTPEKLAKGETAHDAAGNAITGTMEGITETKCNCVSDLHAIWDVLRETVEPYALYCAADRSLTFLCAIDEPTSVHGKEVTWSTEDMGSSSWRNISDDIDTITIEPSFWAYKPIELNSWFEGMRVTDINGLFNIDTSNVNNVTRMFAGCESLTTIDMSGWVMNCECSFSSMFGGCSSLTTIDVSGWVMNYGCDFFYLFEGCSSLTTIDMSGWVMNYECSFSDMFEGCSSLTTIDMSGWVMNCECSFSYLFNECSSLTIVDVSGWVFDSIVCDYMFSTCASLKTIYGDNWENVEGNEMFSGCVSLEGGNGTRWEDVGINDASMAHIDTPDNPGYFTAKE